MMDWEESKWTLVLKQIIVQLSQDKSHQEDLTNYDVCPSNIVDVLRKMGWEDDEQEENGWQQDTWIYFSHPDYEFGLTLYYEGYTFEMKIFRSDIDN
ncbi:MAG: hypothetical protein IJZ40_06880 [Bacteroidaceae bacterium]|nr:hypothetical protein [Bacteroidaceae bacterium]